MDGTVQPPNSICIPKMCAMRLSVTLLKRTASQSKSLVQQSRDNTSMKAIGSIITHGKYNTPIPANQHQSLHSYHNAAMTSIFCVPASFHPVNITTRGTHASESYTLHITRRQARTTICICAFIALYSVTKLTCFVFTNSCTCRCGSHTSWRIPRSRYPEVTLHPPSATTSNPESWARSASV